MEMMQEMIDNYGQENMKALAEYKAKYLPQGTETKLPETPKDQSQKSKNIYVSRIYR